MTMTMKMKMKTEQSDQQALLNPLGLRHRLIAFFMTVMVGAISVFLGNSPTNDVLLFDTNVGNSSNENNATTSTSTSLAESMGFHQGRNIPECCCTFVEIEEVNRNTVYPLLKKVIETPFFAHFKIDLCSSCELWQDMPVCAMKDCSVCECAEPPSWSFDGVDHKPITGPDPDNCAAVADDTVVTTVESYVIDGWQSQSSSSSSSSPEEAFDNNNGFDSFLPGEAFPSLSDPSTANSITTTAQVVDLRLNPEGYTGYTGPSAEKVWSAIHLTNCFQPTTEEKTHNNKDGSNNTGNESPHDDQDDNDDDDDDDRFCNLSSEQRLYNRFISGLHSSISLHIAHSYCLEMSPTIVGECQMWGLNDTMAYDRVLKHTDRVENLYVAFSLLLRAVVKAGGAISAAVPEQLDNDIPQQISRYPEEDDSLLLTTYWSESLLPEIMTLPQKCPNTFNESSLLSDILVDADGADHEESTNARRSELQRRFQHLTSIMQCVGCDRCKLWGTLQTLGIGTALRILFHDDDKNSNGSTIILSRQEAVALVNTLERLSSSLVYAYEFRKRREEKTKLFPSSLSSSSSCSSSS